MKKTLSQICSWLRDLRSLISIFFLETPLGFMLGSLILLGIAEMVKRYCSFTVQMVSLGAGIATVLCGAAYMFYSFWRDRKRRR